MAFLVFEFQMMPSSVILLKPLKKVAENLSHLQVLEYKSRETDENLKGKGKCVIIKII